MIDLSSLNPLKGQADASGAYALYLPAISPVYAKSLDGGNEKYRNRPFPNAIQDNIDALNFLDPNSNLFSSSWALYSAGNAELDLKNARERGIERIIHNRSPETKLVGDSGGYQFRTGAWQYDTDNRVTMDQLCENVLRWQEATCDVIMPLDLPPIDTGGLDNGKSVLRTYDQCLRGTLKNFEYFANNRDHSLQKPILNVLQGTSFQDQQRWYEAVRSTKFDGWAFSWASHENVMRVIHRLAILKNDGELENCQWIHFLGVARLRFAGALTLIMRALRKHVNPNLVLSFDASSPMLMAGKVGKGYHNWFFNDRGSLSEMTFDYHAVPRDIKYIGRKTPFPFVTSPIGHMLEMGHLCVNKKPTSNSSAWDGMSSTLLSNHNTYVHLHAIYQINRFMDHALCGDAQIKLPFEFFEFSNIVEYVLDPKTSLNQAKTRLGEQRDVLQWFDRKAIATVAQLTRSDTMVDWATTDLEEFSNDAEYPWIGEPPENCEY